jgi:hypothetical protein
VIISLPVPAPSDPSSDLFLRDGLGEVVESLAALELGILDDTCIC